MKKWTPFVVLVLAAGALVGCQKPKQTKPEAAAATVPAEGGASTSGMDTPPVATRPVDGATSARQQALAALKTRNVVYFEYDSSEIRAEDLEVVAGHAAYLARYPEAVVRLEGHTDERGSREYNIGLGESRAQAVRKALQLQGVAEAQLTTVSYGEERPAAAGGDEAAFAQNRRVELVHVQ